MGGTKKIERLVEENVSITASPLLVITNGEIVQERASRTYPLLDIGRARKE